jgi:uncharacterized membrane protein
MSAQSPLIERFAPVPIEDYPVPVNPPSRRLESIDLLRGLLMLLMALDHTRDFFSNAQVDPTDPHQSWPALYFTRWVTHLCAPGFVALAGASVYLQGKRGKTRGDIGRLLLTRGLWLILMEVTLVDFGWSFSFFPFLQVIWAIGASMVVLAALQWLGVIAVGLVGAAILLGHNLLDPIHAAQFGSGKDLWLMLHDRGFLTYHGHPFALLFYPVLAWFGVMCVGYAFGPVAASAPAARQRIAAALGVVFLLVFSALRLMNGYGDKYRFEHLSSPARTAMSFFQVQKYPPSLEYVLATFGFLLLLYTLFDIAAARDWLAPVRRFFEVFGRVPFFYYVLHIYTIHGFALLASMAMGLHWQVWIGPAFFTGDRPDGWGYSLPVVYGVWFAVIFVLYWPTRWFSQLKRRRRDWWLSYL